MRRNVQPAGVDGEPWSSTKYTYCVYFYFLARALFVQYLSIKGMYGYNGRLLCLCSNHLTGRERSSLVDVGSFDRLRWKAKATL